MKTKALILGCGGHAHVVAAMLELRSISVSGFVDSSYQGEAEKIYKDLSLLDVPENLADYMDDETDLYLATGDNQSRKKYFEQCCNNYSMPSLVHLTALVEDSVQIGDASQVCLGAKIAVEVTIGRAVLVNTGTIIDHETKIGDFCHVAPGAILAGKVNVEEQCFIGMGSKIDQGITIGANSVIGAGSIILKDVPPNSRIYGIHS